MSEIIDALDCSAMDPAYHVMRHLPCCITFFPFYVKFCGLNCVLDLKKKNDVVGGGCGLRKTKFEDLKMSKLLTVQ